MSTSSSDSYKIIDPLNVLSLKKIQKLKTWCKTHKFTSKQFLEKVNCIMYSYADKKFMPSDNCYQVTLYETRPLTKHQLFEKRLQELRMAREHAESVESKWKDVFSLYNQILSMEPVKKLSSEITDLAIPHPKQIVQQKELYQEQVEKIPDSILRKYFEKCLAIEDIPLTAGKTNISPEAMKSTVVTSVGKTNISPEAMESTAEITDPVTEDRRTENVRCTT